MSMRAAFTTEFIYDGAEGFEKRARKIAKVLDVEWQGKNIVGQLSGVTGGLDLAEEDIRRWLLEMCYELGKITIVSFKIVWLLQGGDIIIKEITPNDQN